MAFLRSVASGLRSLFRKEQLDRELNEELGVYVEMAAEEKMKDGMSRSQANRAVRLENGTVEVTKEVMRAARWETVLESVCQDLHFALRMLRKSPGFTAVVVLTLALGIGTTTAVFSVVDRVLFRALPYSHDDRLVSFGVKAPFEGLEFMLAPEYEVLRSQSTPFESMTSLTPGGADCDITDENPVQLSCALVESTFLSTLGIRPIVGRDFVREDDRPNAPRVALLSYGLWKSRFAANPGVAGRTMSLDGKPIQIIGVLPGEFEMPNLVPADMLLPQALDKSALDRSNPRVVLRAFARLKPGVTMEQAKAGLQPWFRDSLRFVPPQFRAEVSLHARSLRDQQIENSRVGAWVLFGSVLAVLLLACANVASLFLARAVGRQRELAVRSALGASRARLARQTLAESLLLALLGGVAGCGLAYLLLQAFISIAPEGITRLRQASLDLRVLGFGLVVSLLSGVLFGVAPALSHPGPESFTARSISAAGRTWFRHIMVAGQLAGSVILLAGAGLLLRSLWRLESVPLGLETQHVITAQISLAEHRYPDAPKQLAFFREVDTRISRVPGVTQLALSDTLPPSGGIRATFYASIEVAGHARPAQGTGGMVGWRMVTPNYFPALGIRILRGRGFTDEDQAPTENPVILSEALAQKMFSQEDPIGKSLRFTASDRQGPWRTVVGVAADAKNNGLIAPADPELYIPWKDDPGTNVRRAYVTFRTFRTPAAIAPWIRAEIAGLDPTVPVEFGTMEARIGKLTERPRFDAVLLSLFAGFGVVLAALGIYGVVSFFVSQRTQEIGLRMALGATPRGIWRIVLINVARWTLAGVVLGLIGAWFCARLLQSLLFEVRVHDPLLLALAVLILLMVTFFATWVPARRATRVDPLVALRYE